jgi:transcription elongation GreA/GreB family factor
MQAQELLKLAKKEKLDQIESAWLAAIAEGGSDLEALLEVPEVLASRRHADLAETLLWYLVDSLAEAGDLKRALQVARRGGEMLPASTVLRDLLAGLYGRAYGDRGDVDDLIRLTVKSDLPLDEALAGLEKMMALRPGAYVLDRQQGTVGRVRGLDAEKGGLVVALPDGEKVYGAGPVARLEQVEDDDFRALCAFERQRVEALARQDPEELVRIVLSALDRRMELRRLRLYLEPVVGSWTKWWSGARDVLRRSASIGMTEGSSPAIFLRSKPLSHAERLVRRFDSLQEPVPKLTMALEVLREAADGASVPAEALQHLADEASAIAARADEAAVAVLAAAVADAVHEQFAGVRVPPVRYAERMGQVLGDPAALAAAGAGEELLLCALDFIRRRGPGGWQEFFAALMPLVGRTVCEALAHRLQSAGQEEALAEARREILANPDSYPGALAWLWRSCAARLGAEAGPEVDPAAVVMQLFTSLTAVVRSADLGEDERKARIAELRSALSLRDGAPLRQALEKARPEQLAAVKDLAERGAGLTAGMQADLTTMLRGIKPALFEKAVPPWEQGIVYTTEAGIERRRAELEQIVHVRLPEVMREVGQAASFGDVSDNAEYRFAVAERARLAERAGRIQEEISEARVITHEMAVTDHVTVGSRVRLRNLLTAKEETFTFLGPWDARPDEKVYAYNAPLGLAFMGKRVGETVTFQVDSEERRWEVLSLEPAL